ncbi:hypothetical protein J1N35_026441 [Gossypium stocksii]|uniref:Uncharacterized protein n=1 Tax=Gossypium stocksii TaxID=47602 RepID=A0A9D3VAN3_9ROSI|nr:hypothetical protein J1N35_026441 [Gossypium stocksii]
MGVFGIGGFEASIVFGCLNREFRDNFLHQSLFMPKGLPDGAELAYFVKGQNKRGGRVQLLEILLPLSEFDHGVKGHALHVGSFVAPNGLVMDKKLSSSSNRLSSLASVSSSSSLSLASIWRRVWHIL